MGYVAIIAGFTVLVALCMFNFNVIVAAFAAAIAVVLFAGLPFSESLITVFFTRFGSIAGTLFPMFLFGAILAEIYTSSGAAFSIAQAVSKNLFSRAKSDKGKHTLGFLSVIIASAILCYGGINAAVALIAIYPIALGIFQKAGIPKRFIMGAICGGAFTFALSGPGSPQPTNVVAMSIGTSSSCGLIAGLIGCIVEVIVMVLVLSKMSNNAVRNGESFSLGDKDSLLAKCTEKPLFIIAILPIIALLIIFNIFKLNISISIFLTAILSALVFFPNLKKTGIFDCINKGAKSALVPVGAIASVNGFAAVVQSVPEYQELIDRMLSSSLSPILLLVGCVALICMMTGGSTTGTQIALPIIAPVLSSMGVPLSFVHRVGTFAATMLDSLPNSGSVIMAVGLADLKMKDGYPPVFVSTVLATTCGTIAVALIMKMLPMLP